MIRKLFKLLIPKKIRDVIKDSFIESEKYVNKEVLKTYAQYQEDLFVASYFDFKTNGTYIDVGAYDPEDLSNTKKFYLQGWRGINVDASTATIEKFKQQRPDDVNLNCGISDKTENLTFYEFNFGGLSTFNHEDAMVSVKTHPGAVIKSQTEIQCHTLAYLFEMANREVDFISIDVEGYEQVVLRSNDWKKYRPKLVILEINRNTEQLIAYMVSVGYKKIYNNQANGIFIDAKLLQQAN